MTQPEPQQPEDNTADSSSGYDHDFAALIEGYDNQVTYDIDPETWRFPTTPPREHLDRGIAGSLTVERRRAVNEHRAAQTRASNIGLVLLGGLAVAIAVTITVAGAAPIGVVIGVSIAAAAASAVLIDRSLTGPRALDLDKEINAEQQAAAKLQSQLAGTGWTLLYDRVIPDTEQRLAFLAVGPGGVVCLPLLPLPGPYGAADGIFTAAGRSIGEWLTWRNVELRQLSEALIGRPNRDINFQGMVRLVYLNTRTPDPKDPPVPVSIDAVPVCTPADAARLIRGMPHVIPRHQIPALVRLANEACPPAPEPDQT